MAHRRDMQHFLRFSLIAVFVIASLAVLGLASLVLNGPGEVAFGIQQASADNLAGQATALEVYYTGDLILQGQIWQLRLNLVDKVFSIVSPEGDVQEVGLRRVGKFGLSGNWVRDGEIVPVSVDLIDLVAEFHFSDGPVTVALRPMYR